MILPVTYPVLLPDGCIQVGSVVVDIPSDSNPSSLVGKVIDFPVFALGSICSLPCRLGEPQQSVPDGGGK